MVEILSKFFILLLNNKILNQKRKDNIMKKVRKQAKFRRFKDRVKHSYYRSPFLMISTDVLCPEGIALLFEYCRTVCNTEDIAIGIGNFKNNYAPVYVRRKKGLNNYR